MKQYIFTVLFLTFFSILPLEAAEKMRIAVLDLQGEGVSKSTSKAASSMLRTDLVNIGNFIVVERTQMDSILKEQGFQKTGCTDQECAVQLGKLMSAKKILIGELNKLGKSIILNIRIVDVEKGVSEFAAREKAGSIEDLDIAVTEITRKLSAKIGEVPVITRRSVPVVKKPPVTPTYVSVSDDSDVLIDISWNSVSGAEKYNLYRSNSEKGTYSKISTSEENDYIDKNVKEGSVYWYKVKAWSPVGESDFSKAAKGSTLTKDERFNRTVRNYYLLSPFPGISQIYSGKASKGGMILGGFILSGVLMVYGIFDFQNKYDAYMDLPEGTSQNEFDQKNDNKKSAGRFAAGAISITALIYVIHWIDLLAFSKPVASNKSVSYDFNENYYTTFDFNTIDGVNGIESRYFIGFNRKF